MGAYYGEDEIIRETLKQLIAQRGSATVISKRELEQVSGIPLPTLTRSLARLINAGTIRRTFVNGVGHSPNKNIRRGYVYEEIR